MVKRVFDQVARLIPVRIGLCENLCHKNCKVQNPVIRDIRENGLYKKSETKISKSCDPDWYEVRLSPE